ncbi:MAG: hypothetical protein AAF593_00340 [Planctomycetota bacterium]
MMQPEPNDFTGPDVQLDMQRQRVESLISQTRQGAAKVLAMNDNADLLERAAGMDLAAARMLARQTQQLLFVVEDHVSALGMREVLKQQSERAENGR